MTDMPPPIGAPATAAPVGDARLVPLGDITGKPIFDRSGDKLGAIKEVFVDKVTGQIEFVLGATGGFLGVAEKFHPLPWSSLSFNHTPEGYVAAFTRQQLKDAPAYDREQLSSAHYGWGDQVRRYFANLAHPIGPGVIR